MEGSEGAFLFLYSIELRIKSESEFHLRGMFLHLGQEFTVVFQGILEAIALAESEDLEGKSIIFILEKKITGISGDRRGKLHDSLKQNFSTFRQ